jgi:HSP20 family protein
MLHTEEEAQENIGRIRVEMLNLLHDPVRGQRWVSTRQRKTWCPPTDVFETDDHVIVKVEIAGMSEENFAITLDAKTLTVNGVRHDPAAKLGYQQMEILYGHFETHVHVPGAIDTDHMEAVYQKGFLIVRLPKTKPRQVPVLSTEDSDG